MKSSDQDETVKHAVEAYKNGSKEDRVELMKQLQRVGQKWLTDEEFDKRFEHGKKIAMDRGDDELNMQFWIYGHNSKAPEGEREVVMPVMFADFPEEIQSQKQQLMMGLGVKFADEFPDHMLTTIVHISEAWMSQYDQADNIDPDNPPVMPSKDPKRKEIVLVHALSMDHRQSFWQAEIKKDAKGKFTGLETIIEDKYDPEKPVVGKEGMVDRLSVYIMMGNGMAKERGAAENKKEGSNGKTG